MDAPLTDRIEADPNYQALKSRRSRFGWTLTLAMLIVYYGFILLIAFSKGLLAARIGDDIVTASGLTLLGLHRFGCAGQPPQIEQHGLDGDLLLALISCIGERVGHQVAASVVHHDVLAIGWNGRRKDQRAEGDRRQYLRRFHLDIPDQQSQRLGSVLCGTRRHNQTYQPTLLRAGGRAPPIGAYRLVMTSECARFRPHHRHSRSARSRGNIACQRERLR